MNEDLENEIEAINSIYGDKTLVLDEQKDGENVYVLQVPDRASSLRLQFPSSYPAVPPSVLGLQSSGLHSRKGDATHVVDTFRNALGNLYQPGEVCLYDVIEEVINKLDAPQESNHVSKSPTHANEAAERQTKSNTPDAPSLSLQLQKAPPWTLSDVIIESKSVFIARSAPVSSTAQAKRYVQHLLDNDKKARSATHNITAWRIKGENDVTYQDCDDDGETAAGGRVLQLMQLMGLWNVMVIVTRWYGGHHLGPRRFSIINNAARDALVKGGLMVDRKKGPDQKSNI